MDSLFYTKLERSINNCTTKKNKMNPPKWHLCSSNFALLVAFPIGFHTRSVKRDQGRHNFRFFCITVVIGQIFSSAYCCGCWKMKCGDD
ncbi:hypothetical protein T11_17263 [Trichinella zimbabwensis]|uniref:Transmembrane protein n=1 Tax=Trichinella zimbabwensis TaxID=268475 RepID=A0A0V1HLK3_9BILA|nr:hypothetical protein T11_17263 [Trichinella zimbabwensis]